MTTRKRNDERGFDRGRGHYSDNEKGLKLDRRTHFLDKDPSPFGFAGTTTKGRGTTEDDQDTNIRSGFASKLPKK